MEVRKSVRISNSSGLHARPCHAVVSTALDHEAELRVACRGREVNGKSILELMTLNASCGTELELIATGSDAERLIEAIAALVDDGFAEAY